MYGYMKLAAKPKRVPSLRRVDSCPIVTVSQLVSRVDSCPIVTVSQLVSRVDSCPIVTVSQLVIT